jgi:hypothetical protein
MTDRRNHAGEGAETEVQEKARRGPSRLGYIAFAALVLAAVAVLAWILLSALGPDVPEEGVTVEDVVARPDALAGERVTVPGEIANFVVPGEAFPLGEGLEQAVLVLPAEGTRVPTTSEDEVVQVTGTVRSFDLGELSNETAVNLGQGAFDAFDDRPVIVATAIDVIPTDDDAD